MVYAENSNIDEYQNVVLSSQNIFWVKRDGSRVLVCRAGDLIANARLERFPKLETEEVVSTEMMQEISSIFHALEVAVRPREKMKTVKAVRESWTLWFNSHDSLSPLEVILLSEYLMPKDLQNNSTNWSAASLQLFHRSCFIATLFTLGTCALGYHSWKFLREAWILSFSLSSHYSVAGMKTSDLENLRSGDKSSEFVEQLISSVELEFDGLKNVVSRMFENAKGTGGPRGLVPAELTDIERLYAHLESTVSPIVDLNDVKMRDLWKTDHFKIVSKLSDNDGNEVKLVDEIYLEFGL
tara:strand:+ start:133 stop:1023 length:891 start_codon:yes stop_codon:yes gene_type:complete